jgi:hypothetical protein
MKVIYDESNEAARNEEPGGVRVMVWLSDPVDGVCPSIIGLFTDDEKDHPYYFIDRDGTREQLIRRAIRIFDNECAHATDADLPTPDEIRGIARGMTDGKRAEDYLREVRGGNEWQA